MTQTVAGISENFAAFFISLGKRWHVLPWASYLVEYILQSSYYYCFM